MKANSNNLKMVSGMMRNLFLGIALAGMSVICSCSKEEVITPYESMAISSNARNAATIPVTPGAAANGAREQDAAQIHGDKLAANTASTMAAQINADESSGSDSSPQVNALDKQQFIGNQWRLIVGFGSIGEGIDARALRTLESYVELVQNRIGKQILYQSAYIGREGEVEHRFHLREFEGESVISFVADVKELMRNYPTVKVYENAVRLPE